MAQFKAARFIKLDIDPQRLDFVKQKYAGVDTLKADDYTVDHLKGWLRILLS